MVASKLVSYWSLQKAELKWHNLPDCLMELKKYNLPRNLSCWMRIVLQILQARPVGTELGKAIVSPCRHTSLKDCCQQWSQKPACELKSCWQYTEVNHNPQSHLPALDRGLTWAGSANSPLLGRMQLALDFQESLGLTMMAPRKTNQSQR